MRGMPRASRCVAPGAAARGRCALPRHAAAQSNALWWRYTGTLGRAWRLWGDGLPIQARTLHAQLLVEMRKALLPHLAGGCQQEELLAILAALAGRPSRPSIGAVECTPPPCSQHGVFVGASDSTPVLVVAPVTEMASHAHQQDSTGEEVELESVTVPPCAKIDDLPAPYPPVAPSPESMATPKGHSQCTDDPAKQLPAESHVGPEVRVVLDATPTHQEVVEVVSDQQVPANPFLSMFGLVQADLAQLDDRVLNSRSYLCRCRKWHHCIHCDPTGFGS